MKKKKFLALLVVMGLLLGCLAGCGGGDKEEAPAEDAPATEEAADATSDADAAAAELYAMLPETCLSGLMDPATLEDRSDIEKGLVDGKIEVNNPDEVVIGWTEQTQGDPWFVSVGDSAKKWAKEYGYTLLFDVADFELANQSAHVDSYISRDVDVIVIDPVDVTGVAADVERAVAAGIPVFGFGSEIFGAPTITTVNSNIFASGYNTGMYVAEQFGADEQINMGIILGVMGNSTAETRVNSMMTGIIHKRAEMQGIEYTFEQACLDATNLFMDLRKSGTFSSDKWAIACVGSGEGNWTYEGGIDVAEPIIAANQDKLNLIIGENDFQGLGAAQALANYGLTDKVKVASPGNGMKTELEKVKDGTLLCDAPHNGQALAYETMTMIKEMIEGTNTYDANNLPNLTAQASYAITAENMDTYWADDAENLYSKIGRLEILTVPELKAKLEAGTYFDAWVPEE